MSEFGKTYGEQILEYQQNKALWDGISGITDRVVMLVGYIVLIIQSFKVEPSIGVILIMGTFMICAKLDLLRVDK